MADRLSNLDPHVYNPIRISGINSRGTNGNKSEDGMFLPRRCEQVSESYISYQALKLPEDARRRDSSA